MGVTAVHPIPTDTVVAQIDAVLSDIGTDAIKIGMLSQAEIIIAVDEALRRYECQNIVLDPVMVSTSGHRLIDDGAVETLKSTLLFNARVITPNIPEAEVLLGHKIEDESLLAEYAKQLSYAKNINGNQEDDRRVSVLLKAGHLTSDELVDIFYNAETDEIIELRSQRLSTRNTHGTGCTLSAAFATHLALGEGLNKAAKGAKDYIAQALAAGAEYKIGNGYGAVKHFYKYW